MTDDAHPVDDADNNPSDTERDGSRSQDESPDAVAPPTDEPGSPASEKRRRLKIGSQRDEAARFAPKPSAVDTPTPATAPPSSPPQDIPAVAAPPEPASETSGEIATEPLEGEPDEQPARAKVILPPTRLSRTSPELEQEISEALGDASLEDLLGSGDEPTSENVEAESRHVGRVVSIHKEDVFIDFGQRNQGLLSMKQFVTPPEVGANLDVIVSRFDAEEGLYHLALPGGAVDVADWSELTDGVVVEARITGHNQGGLECEVNAIRGFIPASQIAPYRVEDFEQFVGEKFPCLVTEANQQRRNLVLSRRAVLERQREEDRRELLASLSAGDVREGVVRSLQSYGAFVDLGGVDGLLHVSQLSWERVAHPSDLLEVGQRIKVKVQKIDTETGKISLAYRDLTASPWADAARKYPVGQRVEGTVSKIMDFGAFVRLEPGVEGLVHVSELAHGRVWRPSDVVNEGDAVDVQVLSVDQEAQRIGLSMKALSAKPAKQTTGKAEKDEPAEAKSKVKARGGPLKGGIGGPTGGDRFGLKW